MTAFGCIGVIGGAGWNPLVAQVQVLTGGDVLPLPRGSLVCCDSDRYFDSLPQIRDLIRTNPQYRYILTTGSFNKIPRPVFYDLYCDFAMSAHRSPSEILFCTQTFAMSGTTLRILPVSDHLPFSVGNLSSLELVPTLFGAVENSGLWYSKSNVNYVDPYDRFDAMTRGSEMAFWYSPEGFMYLAHQALCNRVYRTQSRRIIGFSIQDLKSDEFIKLIFVFDILGITVRLIYDEDFTQFTEDQGLAGFKIFSRAGAYSFLKIGDELCYSDNSSVADSITAGQEELLGLLCVHDSLEAFMMKFQQVIHKPDRELWRRRARKAKRLIERFNPYPLAMKHAVLDDFVTQWRAI
ncbi:hypothetical protein [Glycomyces harbinensis]|uniref:Uncharacterized protein n=1 Tax=Glycomyces harbinensis TaxID=58114 RepID=A0A1G7B1E5_9ACTN|nr:hypothetical protein [Glycomyces harbinensis]SDE20831.1 hypothetical protein SAMN05216270_11578 [Glycomyces harbinensis]